MQNNTRKADQLAAEFAIGHMADVIVRFTDFHEVLPNGIAVHKCGDATVKLERREYLKWILGVWVIDNKEVDTSLITELCGTNEVYSKLLDIAQYVTTNRGF